jgi:hypothetical protein
MAAYVLDDSSGTRGLLDRPTGHVVVDMVPTNYTRAWIH